MHGKFGRNLNASFLHTFWITQDFRPIFADKAEDLHLLNIIRFIQRENYISTCKYDFAPMTKMTNKEFFCRYIAQSPLWINFVAEALRRKLSIENLYDAPLPALEQTHSTIIRKEVGRTASLASIVGANRSRGPIGVLPRSRSPLGKQKTK